VLTASFWYEDIIDAIEDGIKTGISASVYPNPFNGSAIIYVELQSVEKVSVKIYDLTGTLLSTLGNEMYNSGKHEFVLNILQKGIYFAEISVNGNKKVLKLVSR
jgi:hypothetical protein